MKTTDLKGWKDNNARVVAGHAQEWRVIQNTDKVIEIASEEFLKTEYGKWRDRANACISDLCKRKDILGQEIWKINQQLDMLLHVMGNGASGGTAWTITDIDKINPEPIMENLKSANESLISVLRYIVNDAEPGEDAVLSVTGYNMACEALSRFGKQNPLSA